jgi:hypothetical protein
MEKTMLQILFAVLGALAILASIAVKLIMRAGRRDDGVRHDAPRWRPPRQPRMHALPVWRRKSGAPACQRFSCDRSRTAPRSADVVRAA